MALLLADPCESLIGSQRRWGSIIFGSSNVSSYGAYGRDGGNALRYYYSYTTRPEFKLGVPITSNGYVLGVAMKFNTGFYSSTHDYWVFSIRNSATSDSYPEIAYITLNQAGIIKAWRLINGTETLLASSSPAYTMDNVYNFFEFKIVPHLTAGSIVVRVNEQVVLNYSGTVKQTYSGVDTITSDHVYFSPPSDYGNLYYMYVDDIYLCDTTGATQNDFLGDTTVLRRLMAADSGIGGYSAFTPSSGSNHAALIGEGTLNDTTYVSSSNVNDIDMYSPQALPGSVTSVRGLQVVSHLRKGGTQSRLGAIVNRPAVTDGVGGFPLDADVSIGSNIYPSTDFTGYVRLMGVNPVTGTAWLPGEFNASLFGMKVTG